MSLALTLLVQWLHIVSGVIWFGGYILIDFALWPALLRRPAAEARITFAALENNIGPLMAASGSLVVLLGIVRGTVLGPIKSLDALLGTAYGLTWLTALKAVHEGFFCGVKRRGGVVVAARLIGMG